MGRRSDATALRSKLVSIVTVVFFVFMLGSASNPTSVEARPITCSISASSRTPSQTEFANLVAVDPTYNGARSGRWVMWAPLAARCKSLIGKGQYAYRAQWTVRMRLNKGWPIGVEYRQNRDARFSTELWAIQDAQNVSNGFTYDYSNRASRWGYGAKSSLASEGRTRSYLTELCFAENCAFTIEETGTFGSVTGSDIFSVRAVIEMCFLYAAEGPEGEAETVRCRSGYRGMHFNAHPGTFGMQVTVSGSVTFEPIWTWRQ